MVSAGVVVVPPVPGSDGRVDPAYAAGDLLDALEADGMHLSGVLVTHHHPDHVGGNMMGFELKGLAELLERASVPVHVNTHRFGGGRPRVPDRTCADAIFYVLRTGCQWQALDQTELCAHSTAHDRFQEWVKAGVFLTLWQAGIEQFDELRGIDWQWLSMDGAMTKAPLGGKTTGPNPTDRAKKGEALTPVRGEGRAARDRDRRREHQRLPAAARNA